MSTEPIGLETLRAEATRLGFDRVGVVPAGRLEEEGVRLADWLAAGRHAGMSWMESSQERRIDPGQLLEGCRSVVSLAAFYPGEDAPPEAGNGRIARYARGRDYHRSMGGKARKLALWLQERTGLAARACVDSSPVLEKAWSERAGIGWIGKNTNLIDRRRGSWMLLAEVLSAAELPATEVPAEEFCGSCRACLDACPTDAFPAAWTLDASRCLSYWTIEHRGSLPEWIRESVGDRVFGCDICQEVCPWNIRFAEDREAAGAYEARPELAQVDLTELVRMDEATFRSRFSGTPLMRARWDGMRRNAAVALAGDTAAEAEPALIAALHDEDAQLRAHAAWALGKRGGKRANEALEQRMQHESDPEVMRELKAASREKA